MSDTPISDSTPHNVAELGMLCRRLERELTAANEMFRKLNLHTLNLTDRIKRLEEGGGLALGYASKGDFESADEVWRKAKEAKP
jgi:hypothetical protein